MGIPVELGVGVDVALFVSDALEVPKDDFDDIGGVLKAGHATQRQC